MVGLASFCCQGKQRNPLSSYYMRGGNAVFWSQLGHWRVSIDCLSGDGGNRLLCVDDDDRLYSVIITLSSQHHGQIYCCWERIFQNGRFLSSE